MRRSLATLAAVLAVGITSFAPAAAAKPESRPVDLRLVLTGETVSDSFLTGNDKWFHVNDVQIEVAIFGIFGGEEVIGTGWAGGKSHTSVPEDSSLPPGVGDQGWAHVKPAFASLVTVATGETITCEGWFHIKRTPTNDPFPFAYEDGSTKWKCSDGRRVDATVNGHFEVDPASGVPVFVLIVTGFVR